MRRPLHILRLWLLIAAAVTPAFAGELVVGAKSQLWLDDNVLVTEHDAKEDFWFDLGPTVEVSERFGSVESSLYVKPTYEYYTSESELSGWNYDVSGRLTWNPAPTTTFTLEDTFARYRNLRGFIPGAGTAPPVQQAGRDRFTRNLVQASALHRITPRGQIQLNASHGLWDFTRQNRPRQDYYFGSAQYRYLITQKTSVGVVASFSRQAFDYTGSDDDRHTDYYNSSLSVSYVPAETFLLRASAGPTYLRSPTRELTRLDLIRRSASGGVLVGIPGTCPTLPGGQEYDGPGCQFAPFPFPTLLELDATIPLLGGLEIDNDDWTYFADVAVEREWERASARFSYRRDQGSTSAIGFSSVADTIDVRGSYTVWRNLSLNAAVVWEDREQSQQLLSSDAVTVLGPLVVTPNLVPIAIAPGPGDGRAATTEAIRTLTATFGASYLINERTSVGASISWTDQNASEGSGFGDYQRLYIVIGFTIELEPFRW